MGDRIRRRLVGSCVAAFALLAPLAQAAAPSDVTAPQTKILERSVKPGKRQATFNFTSSEAGGGFRCQLDSRPLGACNPPKTYSRLAYGQHVFRVAAVDSAGNTDPSAAVARFTIPKPKARHRNAH